MVWCAAEEGDAEEVEETIRHALFMCTRRLSCGAAAASHRARDVSGELSTVRSPDEGRKGRATRQMTPATGQTTPNRPSAVNRAGKIGTHTRDDGRAGADDGE
jgi:hypothetical protein